MTMPKGAEWYEPGGPEAGVQAMLEVLVPLSRAMAAVSANRYGREAQSRIIRGVAAIVAAVYSEVPNQSMRQVQEMIDKVIPPDPPAETEPPAGNE